MNDRSFFRRIAAVSAILSAPLALGASAALGVTIGGMNSEVVADPALLVTLGERGGGLVRVIEVIGLFGYYLLIVPLALYLREWLKEHSPNLVNLATVFGLAHIFIGAIGSILFFTAIPALTSAYAQAAETQREVVLIVSRTLTDVGIAGLFAVSAIAGSLWWLGIGPALRAKNRVLGIVTVIVGILILVYGLGASLKIEFLSFLELFTFLTPIWALWLGVLMLRRAGNGSEVDAG